MKTVFLVFSLFLSVCSFGQNDRILKIATTAPEASKDAIRSVHYTSYQMSKFPMPEDDDLPAGQYKLLLKVDRNCQAKLLRDKIKDKRLSDDYLTEFEIILSKYKIEHYHNGKLMPDCDQLLQSTIPITINIVE